MDFEYLSYLIAIELGSVISKDIISGVADALFPFDIERHSEIDNPGVETEGARGGESVLYDWLVTLGNHPTSREHREHLLLQYLFILTRHMPSTRHHINNTILEELGLEITKDSCSITWPWANMNSRIVAATSSRFNSGHYADAVQAAFKEVESTVKSVVMLRVGEELSGTHLMNHAFSENSPIIQIDRLDTESGRNKQVGFMKMAAGAMRGIRNPVAHANLTWSKEYAFNCIMLANFLMDTIETALGEKELITLHNPEFFDDTYG